MLPGEVTMIPVYLLWNNIGKFTLDHPILPHIGTNTQYPLWVPNMFGSAFYIFLQRQFFMGIPRDYFEAARMDGDGYFSMFRRIALPLAKPALIVTFIFEIQAKWFDLITPLIYLRDQALFTAPLGMKILLDRFNAGGGGEGDYQVIMAGTFLLILPMIILFAAFQKYFIRGIAVQGRRGRVATGTCRRDGGPRAVVSGSTSAARSSPPASSTPTGASRASSSRRRRPRAGRRTGCARLFALGRQAVGRRRWRRRSRPSGSAAAGRSTRAAAS